MQMQMVLPFNSCIWEEVPLALLYIGNLWHCWKVSLGPDRINMVFPYLQTAEC